jgi:hypothetical protein
MEKLMLFLLCFAFIVFWVYLLAQIKSVWELTKIFKPWLTEKNIPIQERCSLTVRSGSHDELKTKQSSIAFTTLVPTDVKVG